jgi:hypothetical protein
MAANAFNRLYDAGQPQQSRVQDNLAALVGPVAKALQNTPIMGAAAPAWVPLALASAFTAATGYAAPSMHKDALGYVHVRGRATSAAGVAANATLVPAWPQGFRPSAASVRQFPASGGTTYQALAFSVLGVVTVLNAVGVAGVVDLELCFLAEA